MRQVSLCRIRKVRLALQRCKVQSQARRAGQNNSPAIALARTLHQEWPWRWFLDCAPVASVSVYLKPLKPVSITLGHFWKSYQPRGFAPSSKPSCTGHGRRHEAAFFPLHYCCCIKLVHSVLTLPRVLALSLDRSQDQINALRTTVTVASGSFAWICIRMHPATARAIL